MKFIWISVIFLTGFAPVAAEEISFQAKPESFWSRPLQEHLLSVTGGLPPIHWQTVAGEIRAGDEKNSFIYRAPKRYMRDTLRFYDRAGQMVQVTAEILRPLAVSPAQHTVPAGGNARFNLHGGSGEWELIEDAGLKIIRQDKHVLEIPAGNTAGEKTLSIRDRVTGEVVQPRLYVYTSLDIRHENME